MDEKFIRKRIDEQWAYMHELRFRKCNRHWKKFVTRSALDVLTRLYHDLMIIPGKTPMELVSHCIHMRVHALQLYAPIPRGPFIDDMAVVGEHGQEIINIGATRSGKSAFDLNRKLEKGIQIMDASDAIIREVKNHYGPSPVADLLKTLKNIDIQHKYSEKFRNQQIKSRWKKGL